MRFPMDEVPAPPVAHTAGPWKLCAHMAGTDETCPCGFYGNVWDAKEETIVAFMGPCHPHEEAGCGFDNVVQDVEIRRANARLIASAPDLARENAELREALDKNAEALDQLWEYALSTARQIADARDEARRVLAKK